MDKGISEQLIKQVVASTVGKCASCDQSYDETNVSVLGHQEDLWFFSLACSRCQSRILVAALIAESLQLTVTDLFPDEVERFRDAPTVGPDDVIDVHQFLSDFGGDFKTLFSR